MKTNQAIISLLVVAVLTAACTAGPKAGAPDASGGTTGMTPPAAQQSVNQSLSTPVVPPLIIIAPTEVRTDPTLAGQCWVRLFPEPNFKGTDDLTVAGPIELPSLHTPAGGVFWKHKAESLLVGPKATVTVYENPSYRAKAATLKPGTQEPQLRKALNFTQSIDSLKIACSR